MDKRLTFVALSVADLEKSTAFYQTLLGIPVVATSHDDDLNDPWYGGSHAAHTWTDGAFLHFAIYPAHAPERPITHGAQIGFQVADFEAVHERCVAAGIEIAEAPRDEPWGRVARYLDPDGNIASITPLT